MNPEWSIQSRGDRCAATGEPFKEDEYFYTVLYDEVAGFRREDLSEAAFRDRPEDAPAPFSFWRTKYEPPVPGTPEALGKQTAEDLLRRYMEEDEPELANARFILALMLERKRILKEVETKHDDQGRLLRIYERAKTGEVFMIIDPQLKLEEIAGVQEGIAAQLAG